MKQLRVKVNGQVKQTRTQTCAATCPDTLATDFSFAPTEDGDYRIEVEATDADGNTDTEEIAVTVVHTTERPPQTLALDTEPGLRIRGGAPGDQAGQAIANAGDTNDDGYDDYLVGAPGAEGGRGAAYLLFGSNDATPITLAGESPRFLKFSGAAQGDRAGSAVAAGGDVNGDGRLDFLIGAPGSGPLPHSGSVYVVFGSATPQSLELGNLGQAGFKIVGPPESDAAATSPAPVRFGAQLGTRRLGDFALNGDLNGDGRDELVIGASSEGQLTRPRAGVTYVIFGKPDPETVDLGPTGDPGEAGFRIEGAAPLDQSGQSTAIVGNLNADERADLLLSAPNANALDRAGAGAAYVVFGKADTGAVDLAALGEAGYTIAGAAGDGLTSAAGPGDVNGDLADDVLLGGKGAWVLYGKSSTDSVDLAASFSGYKMTPPDADGYTGARVAGAGDIDGDDSPDALVGFPAANGGSGTGFLVYGQVDPSPLNLASLRGNKGTRLDGSAGAGAATASDGADAGEAGLPGTVVGAPGAAGGAGEVRALAAARFSAAKRENACYDGRTLNVQGQVVQRPWTEGRTFAPPFFYIDAKKPVPRCRRALQGTLDMTSLGRRPYTRTRRCGAASLHCRKSPDNKGNARKKADHLLGTDPVPLKDSFGTPQAYITEVADRCYEISDAQGSHVGFTDADDNCIKDGVEAPVRFQVQGKACMATSELEDGNGTGLGSDPDGHWMVRVMAVDPKKPRGARFTGLQGFIARDLIKTRDQDRQNLIDAYTGCGRTPQRIVLPTGQPLTGDAFSTDPPDRYISPDQVADNCLPVGCGGPYANYQGATFQPNLAVITYASTAVTGSAYGGPGQGGIARAIVPRDRFTERDRMGYSDPNVPCGYPISDPPDPSRPLGQQRVATWVFGDANPDADDKGERHMYGWMPVKKVEGDPLLCP